MKILIESAAIDTIRWACEAQFADGVFLTPGALDADAFGMEPVVQAESVSRLTDGPVVVSLGAVTADDMHREGRAFAKIADHVVVALPFVEDGITALRRLATEGVRTAATFVVTPSQALLAAKAGASFVCVAADQLDTHGHDPSPVLRDTRAIFDGHGIACDTVAVAGGSPRLAAVAAVAGADAAAVTAEALRAMLQHPVTDRSVDHMLGELSRRPRTRPAR